MHLDGIHHISAITADARRNLDTCTRVLGLRLTAKTVNQDDPSVYHLFYGDERARPGADLTFFEIPHAAPGRVGPGMVEAIVWRVGSAAALAFWEERLAAEGWPVVVDGDVVSFSDPDGLRHELVVEDVADTPLVAEHPEIPAEVALQGFAGVRVCAGAPEETLSVLTSVLGGVERSHAAARDAGGVVELRGPVRGGWVAVRPPAEGERGRQGSGTVHHVAFGTVMAEQDDWLRRVEGAGLRTSGHVDRHYFHSIYFREPSGVLYELATAEPGFTVDGPVEELWTRLILPPWLEPRRELIEQRLTPLPDPRAGWA